MAESNVVRQADLGVDVLSDVLLKDAERDAVESGADESPDASVAV